ncbi:MAG: sigma-70 family RNA polymerase sigma factor [Chloroflexi bacterium]|nr:sigma-70 family RNA polymerase sigma factor [Chloroflexota bacterium]
MSIARLMPLSVDGEDDQQFMERIYKEFNLLIYNHACRYFNDQDQIDDVVQQSYLKMMKYLPKLRSLERNILPGYIVNVVKSVAIDQLRKNHRKPSVNFSEFEDNFEESFVNPISLEDEDWEKVNIRQFVQALLKLPESDQNILKAKYILEWSNKDIAGMLGIKENALRVRLHRAKLKALAIYKNEHQDER